MSIKTKLMVGLLSITTLFSVMISLMAIRGIPALQERDMKLGLNLVEKYAKQYDNFFSKRVSSISSYSNTPTLKSMQWNKIDTLFTEELKMSNNFEKLLLGETNGDFYNTTGGNPYFKGKQTSNNKSKGAKLKNISKRDYWKKTIQENAEYVSNPMISLSNGKKQIMIAKSITIENKVVGMVAGSITDEMIQDEVKITNEDIKKYYGKGVFFNILTHQGNWLYHKDPARLIHLDKDNKIVSPHILDFYSQEIFTEIKSGKVGYGTIKYNGDNTFVFYAPIESSDYVMMLLVVEKVLLSKVRSLTLFSIIFGSTLVICGLISIYILNKQIAHPVKDVSNFVKKLSEGNFKQEFSKKTSKFKGEIGVLTSSFIDMNNTIKSIIKSISSNTESLASSSEELSVTSDSFAKSNQSQSASSEEINATIEEISAGMDNISDNALEQLEYVNKLSTNTTKLDNVINTNFKNISDAHQLSNGISKDAKIGEDSLNEINKSMGKIIQSSEEMFDIVKSISGISDQINLLSLNATIESARAGEYGKGFAVVAHEISKLASDSDESLKSIRDLIHTNTAEINNGRQIVENSVVILASIFTKINDIENRIIDIKQGSENQIHIKNEVMEIISLVKEGSEHIKSATEEEKMAIQEIVNSISEITNHIQHNASSSEELSGSAEELSNIAEELKEQVKFFSVC